MKSILLIGLGRFGRYIAEKLHDMQHAVLAVDHDEERVNSILPFVTNALIADSTNADFLRSLDIPNFDVCIVAIGDDFQSSLETTSLLKEFGARYVLDYFPLSDEYAIYEVPVPKAWEGKSIIELDIRRRHHLNILGIKAGDRIDLNISAQTIFAPDAAVLVAGRQEDVAHVFQRNG